MPKIDIVNLIPYHARTAKEPEALTGLTPRTAAERVRESCSEKGTDFRGLVTRDSPTLHHPSQAPLSRSAQQTQGVEG